MPYTEHDLDEILETSEKLRDADLEHAPLSDDEIAWLEDQLYFSLAVHALEGRAPPDALGVVIQRIHPEYLLALIAELKHRRETDEIPNPEGRRLSRH